MHVRRWKAPIPWPWRLLERKRMCSQHAKGWAPVRAPTHLRDTLDSPPLGGRSHAGYDNGDRHVLSVMVRLVRTRSPFLSHYEEPV